MHSCGCPSFSRFFMTFTHIFKPLIHSDFLGWRLLPLTIVVFFSSLEAQAADPAGGVEPPSFPKTFVGSPTFETKEGKEDAGTISLVKIKGKSSLYLLTARHLFSPMGGFKRLITPDEFPKFIKSMSVRPFGPGVPRTYRGKAFPILADYRSEDFWRDSQNSLGDLAAFEVSGNFPASDAAPLAAEPTQEGQVVWVIAQVRFPSGKIAHRAKIITPGWKTPFLVAEFDNAQIETAGASGAPVLNEQGEVIGVYSGHSKSSTQTCALIIPSPLILQHLENNKPAP